MFSVFTGISYAQPIAFADSFCYPVNPVGSPMIGQVVCEVSPVVWIEPDVYHLNEQAFLQWNGGVISGTGGYHLGEDVNGWWPNDTPPPDINRDWGLPVYAVARGVVVWSKNHGGGWGEVIVIKHLLPGKIVYSIYAHLAYRLFGDCETVCDVVSAGQQIGAIGDANGEWSAHLHFEIRNALPEVGSPFSRNAYVPTRQDSLVSQYYHSTCFIQNFNPDDSSSVDQCLGPATVSNGMAGECLFACGTGTGTGGGSDNLPVVGDVVVDVTDVSATFTASVDTKELDARVDFLYGQGREFDNYVSVGTIVGNDYPTTVTATATVLCGRSYSVMGWASSDAGDDYSDPVSFSTPPCTSTDPPADFVINEVGVVSGVCSNIGWSAFGVEYEVHPDVTGNEGLVHELWRNGEVVDTRDGRPEGGQHVMYDNGKGLYTGDTAVYTVVQHNVYGDKPSPPYSFVLPSECGPIPAKPVVVTLPATGLAEGEAMLGVQVTANGPDTQYYFELADSDGTVTQTTLTSAGFDIVPEYFSTQVSLLACGETYTFRAFATNEWGTAQGDLRTFTANCSPRTPPPPELTPEAATVALWHMNGALTDSTKPENAEGNAAYNLGLGGNPTSTTGYNGEPNGAYELDGENDYFSLSGVPAPGTSDLTWMGWTGSDRLNDTNHIIKMEHHDGTGSPSGGLYISGDGRLGAVFSSAYGENPCELQTKDHLIEPFVFAHVGVTRQAGLHRLYVNGLLEAERDCGINADVDVAPGEKWMGRRYNDQHPEAEFFFRGRLDEWHFLNRALSPGEMVDYFYAAGVGNTAPAIAIDEPDGVYDIADGAFTVSWTDTDPDNDALVSLSYSSSPTCSGAVMIAEYINENPDSAADTYWWNTSQIVSGDYYVLATINDGLHPPVSVCSQYPVSVTHDSDVPALLYSKAADTCFSTPPALGDDGKLYARGSAVCHLADGGVVAVNPEDGSTVWSGVIPSSCDRFARDGVSVANGLVYGSMSRAYCSGGGGVAALDARTGSEVFRRVCGNFGINHTPALDEAAGRVYAGAHFLCALNSATGDLAWEGELSWDQGWDSGRGIIVGPSGTVHYGIWKNNNKLGTFSPNGDLLWSMNRPTQDGSHVLAARGDGVLFVYYGDIDMLHAKAASDGTLLWEYPGINRIVVGEDGNLYGSTRQTPEVHALNPNGTKRWSVNLGTLGAVRAELEFVTSDGKLFVRSGNTLYVLLVTDGSVRWSFPASSELKAVALVSGGRLFLSDEEPRHYLLDTSSSYAVSDWSMALFGNRRHTGKVGGVSNDVPGNCPINVTIANQTLSGTRYFRASSEATLGPNLVVEGSDISVEAPMVKLLGGVEIRDILRVGGNPNCTLALP